MSVSQARDSEDPRLSRLRHDLKTPLAMIMGYAELLQTRSDEATRQEAAVRIMEAALRLSAAVDELVALVPADAIPDGR